MSKTQTKANEVAIEVLHRVYQQEGGDMAERSIRAGFSNGKFVIEVRFPCGEDIGPKTYRLDTIDQSRAKFAEIQNEWKAAGWKATETKIWQQLTDGTVREKKRAS